MEVTSTRKGLAARPKITLWCLSSSALYAMTPLPVTTLSDSNAVAVRVTEPPEELVATTPSRSHFAL